MQVIGFQFEKISAERKSFEVKEGLHVQSALNIKDVLEEKIIFLKDQHLLKFVFEFTTAYEPDYAFLFFSGAVVVAVDKSQSDQILKEWKKKEVNPSIQLPLFNLILTKCNVRSLQLEDELGLPLHLQLPKLEQKEKGKSYTG